MFNISRMKNIFNYIINKKNIYLIFLIFIFFLFGLILSEIIDYIFPDFDDKIEDYRIIIEIIGEIGIAYLIYYSFRLQMKITKDEIIF